MGNSRDKKLYEKTKHTMTGWFNNHYKRLLQRQRVKFGKDLPFDRWDLESWVLTRYYDSFVKIFKKWQESNYDKELVPSIDRIDCMKPYDFSNMQIITWKENHEKYNKVERKLYRLDKCEHMVSKTRRPVKQLDFAGKIKATYKSITEAAKITNISTSIICECCQGKRRSSKGYRWSYV